jgi:hypothetical protein
MPRTSILGLLGKVVYRMAAVILCLFAAFHVLAAVSMPILQALGDGLQRANTVQVVAVRQDPVPTVGSRTVER